MQNYLLNSSSNKESCVKDKSISFSTQDTSSKKQFSPKIFDRNYIEPKQGEVRTNIATKKVNVLKVNLSKLK